MPIPLIGKAKRFENIYFYSCSDTSKHLSQEGIYNLMIAIELYLKAQIIVLDTSYANPAKLKKLSHNYKLMYEIIAAQPNEYIAKSLHEALETYNLFEFNINDLKYPLSPRMWSFDSDLVEGKHVFTELFHLIELDVNAKFDTWYGDLRITQ